MSIENLLYRASAEAIGGPGVERNTQTFLETLAAGDGQPLETLAPKDARALLVSAQASEAGISMPPPRVTSTCGSERPSTGRPSVACTSRVAAAPATTRLTPIPTIRCGPSCMILRRVNRAPPISPEMLKGAECGNDQLGGDFPQGGQHHEDGQQQARRVHAPAPSSSASSARAISCHSRAASPHC
ncbi:alpha/beta hydrolase [Pseudomonas sp. TCU-HL1]|nr:alpha/beta hydrolase [Pseudomonas sp. TCU-HL1]